MIKCLFVAAMLIGVGVAGLPLTASATEMSGSLAGTTWVLTETAVQRAAFVPALGDPPPTITFGSDGRVNGNAGCNFYSGPYTEVGNMLNIGPLAVTLRACVDESMNQQEQLILRVLNGTPVQEGNIAFTRYSDSLTLSAPAGALNFVAAASSAGTGTESTGPIPGMPVTGGPDAPGWPALFLALAALAIMAGVRLSRPAQRR